MIIDNIIIIIILTINIAIVIGTIILKIIYHDLLEKVLKRHHIEMKYELSKNNSDEIKSFNLKEKMKSFN